jgi:mono/diheme cytochrome c family protein
MSAFRHAIARTAAGAVLLTATTAAADPRTDYVLHCQGCHRADGSGTANGVPSFRGQLAKFVQVPGGREYLIRVPGSSQSELTDARLAAVLNWMLREFSASPPAHFTPFTTEEVARHRRPPLADVETPRSRLVQAIEALEKAIAKSP